MCWCLGCLSFCSTSALHLCRLVSGMSLSTNICGLSSKFSFSNSHYGNVHDYVMLFVLKKISVTSVLEKMYLSLWKKIHDIREPILSIISSFMIVKNSLLKNQLKRWRLFFNILNWRIAIGHISVLNVVIISLKSSDL